MACSETLSLNLIKVGLYTQGVSQWELRYSEKIREMDRDNLSLFVPLDQREEVRQVCR